MMTNIEFYCPYRIELLFDFFGKFKVSTQDNNYDRESKNKILNAVSILLEQKIIFAGKWIDVNNFEKWDMTIPKIVLQIDNLWKNNTEFPDFYNMVWFGYQSWYIEGLNRLGFERTRNWETFVREKIGDLEQWIEENKPNN